MARKIVIGFFLLFILAVAAYSFLDADALVLRRISVSDVDEVDTIEAYPRRGLYIVGLTRHGALGRFTYHLGIEKSNGNERLLYEVKNKDVFRISKDYISLVDVKIGERNWGWFAVENGKVLESLPDQGLLIDSLGKANKEYFVNGGVGYFYFYVDGKLVKQLNYGNLVTKYKQLNFDSLDYRLYKIQADSIINVSSNANDFFKQENGIYFIPKPGYGLKNKYSKEVALSYVDSIAKEPSPAETIQIRPVE